MSAIGEFLPASGPIANGNPEAVSGHRLKRKRLDRGTALARQGSPQWGKRGIVNNAPRKCKLLSHFAMKKQGGDVSIFHLRRA
jgi:hypothetical protein